MSTRKQILEMLSAGEIDVTRATELLNEARAGDTPPAAEVPPAPPVPPVPPVTPPAPEKPIPAVGQSWRHWLHIHVSDLESGKSRVRVNVPLGLVHFGLKIGARFTDEVNNDMIRDVVDALGDDQLTGTLVEVEDVEDNERVHIFID
jgi:hypothetical protein